MERQLAERRASARRRAASSRKAAVHPVPLLLAPVLLALLLTLLGSAAAEGAKESGERLGAHYRVMPGSVWSAHVQDGLEGRYMVAIHLTERCAVELGELTRRHLSELITLEFAPGVRLTVVVQAHVDSGSASISRIEDETEAHEQVQSILALSGPESVESVAALEGACFQPVE